MVVVRADGELIDSHSGPLSGNQLPLYLQTHLAAAGAPLTPQQAETLTKVVAKVRAARQADDLAAAIAALRPLRSLDKLESYAAPAVQARQLVAELTAEFNEKLDKLTLDEIASAETGGVFETLVKFVSLEQQFKGFRPADEKVSALRKQLRRERALREPLRWAETIVKARLRLEKSPKSRSAAASLQQLVEKAPLPAAAKAARELLEQYPDAVAAAATNPRSTEHGERKKESMFVERTWRDESGKYEVIATFVRVSGGDVELRRQDTGKLITVPLAKLSAADRKYVASVQGSSSKQ